MAVLLPAGAAFADPSPAQIEQQIEQAGDQLEDVIEAFNKVNEELKATEAASTELSAKMQPLLDKLTVAYANVDEIAVTAYKNSGGFSTMSVLLNAGSSDSIVDQLTALRQITRVQQRDISGYSKLKSEYDTERKRLDALRATQSTQRAELESRKVKIEADLGKLQALKRRAEAAGRKPVATNTSYPPPPAVSGRAAAAVQFAYAQLGKPYKWGAAGPGSYDCSGLTQMAWRAAGVSLPHNAAMQWKQVSHVSRSSLAPGDLVFYRSLGHVGIYVGNGNIIHAPTSGDVVKIAGVDRQKPYGYGRPG